MPKYLGYAHRIEYPDDSGKFYEQGQDIPGMTAEDLELLKSRGHVFEDTPAPSPVKATTGSGKK